MRAMHKNLVLPAIAGAACAAVLIVGGVTAIADHATIRAQEERLGDLARELDAAELASAPAEADPARVDADSVAIERLAADEFGSTVGESRATLLSVRGLTYDYLVWTEVESSPGEGRRIATMLVSVDADGGVSEVSVLASTVAR